MKSSSVRIFAFAVLSLSAQCNAEDFKSRLSATDSLDSIRAFYSKFRRYGTLHEATCQTHAYKLFLYWVQPHEREAPTFVWVYVLKGGKWRLIVDHPETNRFEGSQVLVSPTDETVRVVNAAGETIKTYQIEPKAP